MALFAGFVFCNTPALADSNKAESPSLEQLLNLPLESLMDVSIVTTAKKLEKKSETAGIVSVVTAEDIRRYGAKTLLDVLRRMPSVFPTGASDITGSMNSVRGMHSSSINKHLLMLLNGRPIRDAYAGGINSSIYRGFPIDAIERVELVRGPGSVLYGSGAFAGVVNIITKAPVKGQKLESNIYTGYGSFNTKEIGTTVRGSYQNAQFAFSGRSLSTDGFDFQAFDTAAVFGGDDMGQSNYAMTGQLYYKNLTVSVLEAYTQEDSFSTGAVYPFIKRMDRRKHVDLGYVYDLTDKFQAHLNLTYGNTAYGFSDNAISSKSHDLLTEVYVQGDFSEKISLLAGVNYDDLRGSTKPNAALLNSKKFRNIWQSAYFQFEFKPWQKIKVIAGGQYNDANGLTNFSPRFGVVTHWNNNWGGKVLYGEAFRSPSGLETSFLVPGVITGNENLKPELVETFDIQIFYKNKWLNSSLTYFETTQKDSVEVAFNAGLGLLEFVNAGETEFKGVEWETSARLNKNWSLDSSLSFQENKTDQGVVDSQYTPNIMAKLGVTYTNDNGVTIGLFDSYLGEPGLTKNLQATQSLNPEGKNYHHVTANVEFDIPKLTQSSKLPKMTFSIFGDNLLEPHPINFPDDTERSINTLPRYGGRSIFARLKIEM